MTEMLVRVDGNDNRIGLEEKQKCHLPDGLLHRAFTAILFDADGRICLGKRSESKMLWPGYWDGTFASHPRDAESYVDSGERRMPEEMGHTCRLQYANKFEYHVPYRDIGSENEICATLIGVLDDPKSAKAMPEEVSEIDWVLPDRLLSKLESDPRPYCPWMIIALYFMQESDQAVLNRHRSILQDWLDADSRRILLGAIEKHIPDQRWRQVK